MRMTMTERYTPSTKTPEMTRFLEQAGGRTTAILTSSCSLCGKLVSPFRDELSAKEYTISGLCQKCQDVFFADD